MKWSQDDSTTLIEHTVHTKYGKREIVVVLYVYPNTEEVFVSVKGDINVRIEHIRVTPDGRGEINPGELGLNEYMTAKEAVDSAIPVLRKTAMKLARDLAKQTTARVRAGAKR